ncbi:MAG: LCP family protein [Oscillospiraceae bacterium]|nr:LCP family protein [Oscillospiraceae bacterium]
MKNGKRVARKNGAGNGPSDASKIPKTRGGRRTGTPRAEKKAKSKTPRILLGSLCGLLLIGAAVLAYLFWPQAPDQPRPPNIVPPSLPPEQRTPRPSGMTPSPDEILQEAEFNPNVHLILGAANFDGGNTDTIMLGALNYKENTLHVLSIPRDTVIQYNGRQRRINTIFSLGEQNKRGSGMETLAMELYKLLGIHSGNTVYIRANAFTRAVNAVGGVEFDVPINMYKPYENIDLKRGQQRLYGAEALMLLRYRGYGRNNQAGVSHDDYGRMEMQQRFLKEAARQILTVGNIPKIPEFVNIFNENVATTLTTNNISWFANEMTKVPNENIHFHTLPTQTNIVNGAYYEYIKVEEALEILQYINPYTMPITREMLRIDYAAQ